MTLIRACLLSASLAAAGVAQAQTASSPSSPPSPPADDSSLTWKGITLYGIVDIGLQYQTHGAPLNDYSPYGTEPTIQKNSNGSITSLSDGNLSPSRVGLSGNEPLVGDWAGVFRVESVFNPTGGVLIDGPKSLTQNNGVALTAQNTNLDSSLAGQLFNGAAYVGFASPTYGSFTFGRQLTTLADGMLIYDPQGNAPAFSLLASGTYTGGGDTEDKRLDHTLKYAAHYDWLHLGALYQFSGSSGSFNTAIQAQLGADFAGFSVDGFYDKKYDAVSAAALSAKQVEGLAALCNPAVPPVTPNPNGATCFSSNNSLAGTISDNTVYTLAAKYAFETVKLYAGYEHINYANPSTPIEPGYVIPGGYTLAYTTLDAYNINKTLKVYWGGVKWSATPALDLTAAYYGYKQNSYATGADAGCSTNVSSKCSGSFDAFSVSADYRLSKRFDAYIGTFWSQVTDGPSEEFLNTSTLTTTVGLRFKF